MLRLLHRGNYTKIEHLFALRNMIQNACEIAEYCDGDCHTCYAKPACDDFHRLLKHVNSLIEQKENRL